MSWTNSAEPETLEHARLVSCWCSDAPKPCPYHEGFDDSAKKSKANLRRGLDTPDAYHPDEPLPHEAIYGNVKHRMTCCAVDEALVTAVLNRQVDDSPPYGRDPLGLGPEA